MVGRPLCFFIFGLRPHQTRQPAKTASTAPPGEQELGEQQKLSLVFFLSFFLYKWPLEDSRASHNCKICKNWIFNTIRANKFSVSSTDSLHFFRNRYPIDSHFPFPNYSLRNYRHVYVSTTYTYTYTCVCVCFFCLEKSLRGNFMVLV